MQASGWREINREIMCTDCRKDYCSAALFTKGGMHHTMVKTMSICI